MAGTGPRTGPANGKRMAWPMSSLSIRPWLLIHVPFSRTARRDGPCQSTRFRQAQNILTRAGTRWLIGVEPGKPVRPFGLGQNARTTGGAGILPAASLQRRPSAFLPAQKPAGIKYTKQAW